MNKSPTVHLHSVRALRSEEMMRTNADGTISMHIPISFKKRGGRCYIISPDIIPPEYLPQKEYAPLLKAIAQAFHWKEMIERGEASSTRDLAGKIKMNESYVARVLRLANLAPDIIEAILNGRQPKALTLADLSKPIPHDWDEQRLQYGFATNA